MVNIVNYLFWLYNLRCSFPICSESNPINIWQFLCLFVQLGMKYHCMLCEKEKKGSRGLQSPAVQLITTTDCPGSLLGLFPNLCGATSFLNPLYNSEEKLDFFHHRDHNHLQRLKSLHQWCLIQPLVSVTRRGGEKTSGQWNTYLCFPLRQDT